MGDVTRRTFLQIASALAVAACGDDPTAEAEAKGPDGPQAPAPDGGTDPGPDPMVPAGPTVVPGVDLDAIPLAAKSFPYGVMAGDATATNVMLWTRFTGTAGELFVQLEAEGAPKGEAVISRAVSATERGDGGFVHVDGAGLVAGARYRYAFFVMEDGKSTGRGPFGTVRAALAPGALEVITFAGTSCTHQMSAPYPLMADAAKRKVDFFIHGGDHVYCDADADAITLAQYRAKYAMTWGAAGMSALHGSTGMVLTWDDHEIFNNWNPENAAAARVDTAKKAYFEHRASRRDPAAPNRLWKSLVWGDTLELLVLDVRSERKPSTRNTPGAQFITPEQMTWLEQRLKASTAVFKLIITSVPITNFPASAAGEADKWEGYPAQRDRILDFIEENGVKGAWWLSGDLHFGSVGNIEATGPRAKMKEVLMGPGGTNARTDLGLSATQFDRVIEEKNYTVFRADPVKRELTVDFIGAKGSIFKRTYAA